MYRTDPNGLLCKIDTPFIERLSTLHILRSKVHANFGKTVFCPISNCHFLSFNTLSSSEIYHITILKDLLIKYRPFKCNIDHKFKNIDQLSQKVDYRPMVDNIDPLAALATFFTFHIFLFFASSLIILSRLKGLSF